MSKRKYKEEVGPKILDFTEVCRTCCASDGKLISLYEHRGNGTSTLVEMLMTCTFIELNRSDGLPAQICWQCVTELKRSYGFAIKCLKSDTLLRRTLVEPIDVAGIVIDGDESTLHTFLDKRTNYKQESPSTQAPLTSDSDADLQPIRKRPMKRKQPTVTATAPASAEPILTKIDEIIAKNEAILNNKSIPIDIPTKSESQPVEIPDNSAPLDIEIDPLNLNTDPTTILSDQSKKSLVNIINKNFNMAGDKKKFIVKLQPMSELKNLPNKSKIKTIVINNNKTAQKPENLAQQSIIIQISDDESLDPAQLDPLLDPQVVASIPTENPPGNRSVLDQSQELGGVPDDLGGVDGLGGGDDAERVLDPEVEIKNDLDDSDQSDMNGTIEFLHSDLSNCTFEDEDEEQMPVEVLFDEFNDENEDQDEDKKELLKNFFANPVQTIKQLEKTKGKLQFPDITDQLLLSDLRKRSYECNMCCESYPTRKLLHDHKKAKHVPQYEQRQCPICSKMVSHKHYPKHVRAHTSKHSYICDECGKHYANESTLKRHKMIHRGLKPYKCDICNKGFPQAFSMKEHRRIHTGEKPFVCYICGNQFRSSVYLKHHMDLHERKNQVEENGTDTLQRKHACVICPKQFHYKSSLDKHIRTHTESECDATLKGPYTCSECGLEFDQLRGYKTHMTTHMDRPYGCVHCRKAFVTLDRLKMHQRYNHAARPFQCEICSKCFSQKMNLQVHMKLHTGEKDFFCEQCGKAFFSLIHLKRHMLTHTGVKSYKCKFCGKAFALNGNLTVHMRTHTGETPHVCDTCNRGFYDTSSLRRHIRKSHPGVLEEKQTAVVVDGGTT